MGQFSDCCSKRLQERFLTSGKESATVLERKSNTVWMKSERGPTLAEGKVQAEIVYCVP